MGQEKIIELITKLAETGSTTGLWFYGIYLFGSIMKFVIGFGCVLMGIKTFCKTWKGVSNAK